MRILIFHFFFIGVGTVFSLKVTGSFWLTLLLFVIFGVIPVFRLNEYPGLLTSSQFGQQPRYSRSYDDASILFEGLFFKIFFENTITMCWIFTEEFLSQEEEVNSPE